MTISERNGRHAYIEGFAKLADSSLIISDQNQFAWWMTAKSRSNTDTADLLRYILVFVDKPTLKGLCRHEKLVIASDGSYHPKYRIGTAAIIIETESGISIAKGYCKTHGNKDDVNAYRSELMGIFLGMTCAHNITELLGLEHGSIE